MDPNALDDPDQLRRLMANARRLGHEDIALACRRRIAELAGHRFDDELEREFWTAVAAAEEVASQINGKTTRLNRTRQKERRDGFYDCLLALAGSNEPRKGFLLLAESGQGDLTFEAIVVRHAGKFPDTVVETAADRLRKYGILP